MPRMPFYTFNTCEPGKEQNRSLARGHVSLASHDPVSLDLREAQPLELPLSAAGALPCPPPQLPPVWPPQLPLSAAHSCFDLCEAQPPERDSWPPPKWVVRPPQLPPVRRPQLLPQGVERDLHVDLTGRVWIAEGV